MPGGCGIMLTRRVRNIQVFFRYFTRSFTSLGSSDENPEKWTTSIVDKVVSNYGNLRLVHWVFKTNPELEQSDIYLWKNFIVAMVENGIGVEDSLKIVGRHPAVLSLTREHLLSSLLEWRKGHFGVDSLRFLFLNRPEFLQVDAENVRRRLPFYDSHCPKPDLLMQLLFLCPNLMFENLDAIAEKINFLTNEMVVYQTEVFGCKALSKTIEHLKIRFSILEMCGLYKRPTPYEHKKTKKERLQLNNPKLKNITDRSDVSFARKVAKITLEEYEVFVEAFTNKVESSDDELSDSEGSYSEK